MRTEAREIFGQLEVSTLARKTSKNLWRTVAPARALSHVGTILDPLVALECSTFSFLLLQFIYSTNLLTITVLLEREVM